MSTNMSPWQNARIEPLLQELSRLVPSAGERLAMNVPMSSHTTFRAGGPADIFFEPESQEEIVRVLRFCRDEQIPFTLVGNGSNILVSDRGIRGVVLAIGEKLSGIERHNDMLLIKAGTRLASIAAFAAQQGLRGLEFASGIPGTLGGAILMNAGAYEHCMAEVMILTEYLDANLEIKSVIGLEHCFSYRKSLFSDGSGIILRACLQLQPDDPQLILNRMADLACRRRSSQPLDLPSAGSAFKRPAGFYAGKLISDCGLKGCCIGRAQVSEKHAGFIVNLGQASATDIRRLFEKVQHTVAERTGVYLEPEVKFVGDWGDWQRKCGQDAAGRPLEG